MQLNKRVVIGLSGGVPPTSSRTRLRKGKRSRVAIGLSGGVDSAVSAALLKEQGYDVTGVFLECWSSSAQGYGRTSAGSGCRAEEDRKDALDIALQLGIPFEVLDFKEAYKQKVVDYFYREYEAGRTPNPDVMCNREIKFGLFYEEMIQNRGFDYVATGHYAQVLGAESIEQRVRRTQSSKHYALCRGFDDKKDQSYFLYQLRQEQLSHILFPIGHLTKTQVRAEAEKRGLKVATKPDSQGICFIGEVSVTSFLKDLGMEEKEGDILLATGSYRSLRSLQDDNIIGEHRGAWFYTIGQRIGLAQRAEADVFKQLGLDPSNLPPLYVIEKDVKQNRLVVGPRELLYRDTFEIEQVHWIDQEARLTINELREVQVRIRHLGKLIESKIQHRESSIQVQQAEPAFGVAPGQACVIYRGEQVLGGGVIV